MQRQHIIRLLFLAVLATAFTQGCYYDKEELLYPGSNTPANCSTINAKFSADVFPLITAKCSLSGCHDAASGRITFLNYAQISGAAARINTRVVVEKSMPQTGPLQQSEINIIKCWIESGAPNN